MLIAAKAGVTYHSNSHRRHEDRLDPEHVLELVCGDEKQWKLDEPIQEVRNHAGGGQTGGRRQMVRQPCEARPDSGEHLE
jgi:hypothetical protein